MGARIRCAISFATASLGTEWSTPRERVRAIQLQTWHPVVISEDGTLWHYCPPSPQAVRKSGNRPLSAPNRQLTFIVSVSVRPGGDDIFSLMG